MTMKNAVFWDVTLRGSCKSRRFGRTYSFLHQGENNQRAKNNVNKTNSMALSPVTSK
jgi:hypothetical protein